MNIIPKVSVINLPDISLPTPDTACSILLLPALCLPAFLPVLLIFPLPAFDVYLTVNLMKYFIPMSRITTNVCTCSASVRRYANHSAYIILSHPQDSFLRWRKHLRFKNLLKFTNKQMQKWSWISKLPPQPKAQISQRH